MSVAFVFFISLRELHSSAFCIGVLMLLVKLHECTDCHLVDFFFFLFFLFVCVQEANSTPSLITLKVDPDGFFLYWSGGTNMVSYFPFCLYQQIPALAWHMLLVLVLSKNPLLCFNVSFVEIILKYGKSCCHVS